jgi:outer membrane protein TolC
MYKYLLHILFFVTFTAVKAQNVLNYSDYINKVLEDHPFSKLADLEISAAKANLLKAKGNFDPYISYQYSEKKFMDQNYYTIHQGKLIVPTGLGPNLNVGYERANGNFLNPQWKLPNDGLVNMGINIPLLQGLIIDESRAFLRQAKAIYRASEVEKKLVLNQIILNSTFQYWYWFESYNKLLVADKGVLLATERLNASVTSAKAGDIPFVDTLETNIQLQNRLVNFQKNYGEFKINELQLDFFLWTDTVKTKTENTPPYYMLFNPPIVPDLNLDSLNIKLKFHPELNQKVLKLKMLEYDKKMAWEYFKPQVNLNYNPLADFNDVFNQPYVNPNNYKLGLDIKIPIFYRKQMGNLQSISIYQEQTKIELDTKQREIYNESMSLYIELQALEKQINTQKNNLQNNLDLLKAEQEKFKLGESSVFMVNTRENAYLNAEIKLIELISKQQITLVKYLYYANEL